MRAKLLQHLLIPAATLVLLPALASAQTPYFCSAVGHIMASRCCSMHAAAPQPGGGAEVRGPECCRRIAPSERPAVPGTREATTRVPPPTLLASLPWTPRIVSTARLVRAARDARYLYVLGPPLFIAHCALLN